MEKVDRKFSVHIFRRIFLSISLIRFYIFSLTQGQILYFGIRVRGARMQFMCLQVDRLTFVHS